MALPIPRLTSSAAVRHLVRTNILSAILLHQKLRWMQSQLSSCSFWNEQRTTIWLPASWNPGMSNPDAIDAMHETAHAPLQLWEPPYQGYHVFGSLNLSFGCNMASSRWCEVPDLLACGATRSSFWHTTGEAGPSPSFSPKLLEAAAFQCPQCELKGT